MTKEELMKEYQTKEVGDSSELVIANPGEFEGMPLFVPYFWDFVMNGEGEVLLSVPFDRTYNVLEISPEEKQMFPEISQNFIVIWKDDQGFVKYELMTEENIKQFESEINKENAEAEGGEVEGAKGWEHICPKCGKIETGDTIEKTYKDGETKTICKFCREEVKNNKVEGLRKKRTLKTRTQMRAIWLKGI